MFDIHAHILPALEDGPETFEEALRLVAELAREGVSEIAATPRFGNRFPRLPISDVRERAAALERVVRAAGVAVRLRVGHEIEFGPETEDALVRGAASTLNDGPYALIALTTAERPGATLPESLPETIVRLRMAGIIPVLAGVERYSAVQRDPDTLVPLVRLGALLQVTVSSLAGAHGVAARRAAEALLPRNLAHVLASGVRGGAAAPHVTAGLRCAEMIVGRQRVWDMTVGVPQAMLRGAPVAPPPVLPAASPWCRDDGQRQRRSS